MTTSFPPPGPVTPYWAMKVTGGLGLALRVALHFLGVWPAGAAPLPLVIGQGLVLVGAGINIQHYRFLKRQNPNIASPGFLEAEKGLYRWIRHPMYFGDLVLMIGLALVTSDLVSALLLAIGTVGVGVQSRIEDALMARMFGESFEAWRKRTRLLIPGIF